jgi:tetratricopeptide (TPR) repeat protein
MKLTILMSIKVLLGIIFFVFYPYSNEEANGFCSFEIKISSGKTQYFVFEPIFVHYQIRNTSDTTVCFVLDRAKEFFNIKDQEGRGYHNTELSEYLFCPDTLKPNQALDDWEDIRERYRMDNAGSYVCFNNFHGCSSNVLNIEVVRPTGEEEKALALFEEAYRLHWSCDDKDTEKWGELFFRYSELAERFPRSVYAPVALRLALARGYTIEDKRVVIGVAKKLIEEYPSSHYLALTFLYLIDNYKFLQDKSVAIDYMNELIAKYPRSQISERAEHWLKKIEEWEF